MLALFRRAAPALFTRISQMSQAGGKRQREAEGLVEDDEPAPGPPAPPPGGAGDEEEEDIGPVGPAPPQAKKKRARAMRGRASLFLRKQKMSLFSLRAQVLQHEQVYLDALPSAVMYEKSYMHRDVVTHAVRPSVLALPRHTHRASNHSVR